MKNVLISIAPYIAIAFLALALFSKCQNEKTLIANVSALQSENKTYKLENGKIATSTQTVTLPKKQVPEIPETKPFSKVESIVSTVYETVIDTVYVPFIDSIPCVFKKEGQFSNKEQSFRYTVDSSGFGIYNQVIRDSLTIVHGSKRNWIFGPEIRTVDISHSNKYVIVRNLSHNEFRDPKKWYDTGLAKFVAGVTVGYAITK